MKTYDQVKEKLENCTDFRERRFRGRYIVDMVLEKNGKSGSMFIDVNSLQDLAEDYATYIRNWQLVLKENKDLRGEDYGDKEIYEQESMVKYGYESGYNKSLKI